jgi:hypothetical protein
MKRSATVKFTKSELSDICHALLMTGTEYLCRNTSAGNDISSGMGKLYDRLRPVCDNLKGEY